MPSENFRLVIGNKNASSWSLRPWLAMKRFSIPFEEIRINLRSPDRKQEILRHSPSGKVPALYAGDMIVWDSLGILEYLADRFPDCHVWPKDDTARALARCVSAEMHAGFQALREQCPMDFLEHTPRASFDDSVAHDIQRIVALWIDCRRRFGAGGPFLFGKFTAADAMYAPVSSRFRTFVADLAAYGDDGTAVRYVETLFAMPEMAEWARGAESQLAGDDFSNAG